MTVKRYIITADDVVDNLTSTDTTVPLSAKQGNVLAGRVSTVEGKTANATTSTAGIVKIGSGISVSSGTISVANATTSSKGIVQVGSGLSVSNGVISVSGGASKLSVTGTTTQTTMLFGSVTRPAYTCPTNTSFTIPAYSFTKSSTAPLFLESNGSFTGLSDSVYLTISGSYWNWSCSVKYKLTNSSGVAVLDATWSKSYTVSTDYSFNTASFTNDGGAYTLTISTSNCSATAKTNAITADVYC